MRLTCFWAILAVSVATGCDRSRLESELRRTQEELRQERQFRLDHEEAQERSRNLSALDFTGRISELRRDPEAVLGMRIAFNGFLDALSVTRVDFTVYKEARSLGMEPEVYAFRIRGIDEPPEDAPLFYPNPGGGLERQGGRLIHRNAPMNTFFFGCTPNLRDSILRVTNEHKLAIAPHPASIGESWCAVRVFGTVDYADHLHRQRWIQSYVETKRQDPRYPGNDAEIHASALRAASTYPEVAHPCVKIYRIEFYSTPTFDGEPFAECYDEGFLLHN